MYGANFAAYRQTDILTGDPKRLVILCYDGAIESLNLAKAKYLSEDYMAKGLAVQKALDIIDYLREILDFEKGGEIAKLLDQIYNFMIRHILKSDRERNVNGFQEVIKMLEELKSAWEEIFYGYPDSKNAFLPQEGLGSSASARGHSLEIK
jgi:flagellar protein FliS